MKEHAENCGFVLFKSVVPYVDTVILLDTDISIHIDEMQDVACCLPCGGMEEYRSADFIITSVQEKNDQFDVCSCHNSDCGISVKCDAGMGKQAIEQIIRMYLGPRFIDIDFTDCSILQKGYCHFKTNMFYIPDIWRQLADWLDTMDIKNQEEILIYIDGFLSLTELQKCLEYVYEELSMVGKIFINYNAMLRKDTKKIQISILFAG